MFSSFAAFLLSSCISLHAAISVLAVATAGTAVENIFIKHPEKAVYDLTSGASSGWISRSFQKI